MALVLNKICNAANVRFRARPSGLTGVSMLGVMTFRQVPTCFQSHVLITNKPVRQKHYIIDQRLPNLFLCIVCMFALFAGTIVLGKTIFGLSLVLMLASLGYSLQEILLSVQALNLELSELQKHK